MNKDVERVVKQLRSDGYEEAAVMLEKVHADALEAIIQHGTWQGWAETYEQVVSEVHGLAVEWEQQNGQIWNSIAGRKLRDLIANRLGPAYKPEDHEVKLHDDDEFVTMRTEAWRRITRELMQLRTQTADSEDRTVSDLEIRSKAAEVAAVLYSGTDGPKRQVFLDTIPRVEKYLRGQE